MTLFKEPRRAQRIGAWRSTVEGRIAGCPWGTHGGGISRQSPRSGTVPGCGGRAAGCWGGRRKVDPGSVPGGSPACQNIFPDGRSWDSGPYRKSHAGELFREKFDLQILWFLAVKMVQQARKPLLSTWLFPLQDEGKAGRNQLDGINKETRR